MRCLIGRVAYALNACVVPGGIVAIMALTAGCATLSSRIDPGIEAGQIARHGGLERLEIPAGQFTLLAYAKFNDKEQPLTVYLEGDGLAWLSRRRLSDDPTPRQALVLRIAAQDPAPNVAYLARPCQYLHNAACDPVYWSDRRYSAEVIESVDRAIDELLSRSGAHTIRLVGYSGGAAVALLIAQRRTDVSDIRTLAGNVDPEAVNLHHNVAPLTGSLNPLDNLSLIRGLPQQHYIGSNDTIVPVRILRDYLVKLGNPPTAKLTVLPGVTHNDGWERHWGAVVGRPPREKNSSFDT